jgi:hypothetical protein
MPYSTKIKNDLSPVQKHALVIESYLTDYCRMDSQLSAASFIASFSEAFLEEVCPEVRGLPAALIISESADEAYLEIHLSKEIYTKLMSEPNLPDLLNHREGLNSFLILAEEISHFHHYLRNAEIGAPVRRFDLELQAEIDKLVIGSLILNKIFGQSQTNQLTHILFNEVSFHGSMTDYALASKITEKFWKYHLTLLGKNMIFNSRFRRIIQIMTRTSGDEKIRLLNSEMKNAA